MIQDTTKHQGQRRKLLASIREKGITDERVLEAMMKVPRHLFLDSSFEQYAYQDKPFPIAAEQTISQPYTVAFQTQLLDLKPGMKVLEIGTGSGYQTAVLLEMGAKVYSIERQIALFHPTKLLLNKLGYRPVLKYGDGYKGLPSFAPFSRILVTAGAPEVPNALLTQLEVGGILVIPVGEKEQQMKRYIKLNEKEFKVENHGAFRFVPMLGDKSVQR